MCNAGNTGLDSRQEWVEAFDSTAVFGVYISGTTGKKFGYAPFVISESRTRYQSFSFGSIADGLSNTLGNTEVLQGKAGPGFNPNDSATESAHDLRGYVYHWLGCYFTTLYTPNTASPDSIAPTTWGTNAYCFSEPKMPCLGQWGAGTYLSARSRHTGGVNAGLLDGSVRFVSDTTSWDVWQALGTARGGESAAL